MLKLLIFAAELGYSIAPEPILSDVADKRTDWALIIREWHWQTEAKAR